MEYGSKHGSDLHNVAGAGFGPFFGLPQFFVCFIDYKKWHLANGNDID